MPDYLILTAAVFMAAPLLALFINNIFGRATAGKFCINLGIGVALLQIISAVSNMILLLASHKSYVDFSLFWDISSQTGASYFRVDILSLVILLSIGTVALVSLLTARATINDGALNFCNLLLCVMLGMNGMAVVNDLFSLYVFLEITGISSFVMIALFKDKHGLEGAFKYLTMSAIASAFLLASLAMIFMEAGSLRFDIVAEKITSWETASQPLLLLAAFVFLVTAVSIKTGFIPFHGWLPDAYQSAPPAVSVLLGGIVTKVSGAYAVIRILSGVLTEAKGFNIILGVLAVVSIIFGAVFAISQSDFKRILAYSSISQIGYIVLGAACGNILGLVGAAFHFFNHAVFKSTLFVNAAALEQKAGTCDIDRMGGLGEKMPVTATSAALAFLSAAGIPPLAGFWSKLLIIIACWQAGYIVFAAAALFASILTLAYFLRLNSKVFFGEPAEDMDNVKEAGKPLCFAEILTSCITVGLGLGLPALLLFLQAQGLF